MISAQNHLPARVSHTRAAIASRQGFSLVELLVTVGIIALLMVMAVPAYTSISEASDLRRSAQIILDELNLARQLALSRSQQVEVRFYKHGATEAGTEHFRAVRVMTIDRTGKMDPGTLRVLPTFAVISSHTDYKYSPLIKQNLQDTSDPADPPATQSNYASFRFRPSGETSLTPIEGPGGDGWYVTVQALRTHSGTGLPDNYITVAIDAFTGRARLFQP